MDRVSAAGELPRRGDRGAEGLSAPPRGLDQDPAGHELLSGAGDVRGARLWNDAGEPCGPPAIASLGRYGLEVDRQVPPHETRRVDGGRIVPGATKSSVADGVLIVVLVRRRVVGVQQIAQVDTDVRSPPAEPEYLREAHVDLRPPIVGVQLMVTVEDVDRRVAVEGATGRQPAQAGEDHGV